MQETQRPSKVKYLVNAIIAFILLLLSVVLLLEDLNYPGNLLFYTPVSILFLVIFFFIWFVAACVSSIIPKRFVLTIGLIFLSRLALAYPLTHFMGNNAAFRILDVVLIVAAVIYAITSLLKLWDRGKHRPWLQLKHSLIMLGCGVVIFVASIPILLGGFTRGFHNVVGDYTRFSFKSVSLVERIFEKDGTKVFLVGMMHIGEPGFYQQLTERLESQIEGKRAVLMEGVMDEENILPKGFKEGKTYGDMANKFGLVMQTLGSGPGEIEHPENGWTKGNVEFIPADIDVSELSAEHKDLLVQLLELMGSGGMFVTPPDDLTPKDLEDLMVDGLIGFRNDRLMEKFTEIETRGDVNEIYIPWGAAHLGDIETRIKDKGYTEVSEQIRPVFRFWNKK